jgi:hypothetical protein
LPLRLCLKLPGKPVQQPCNRPIHRMLFVICRLLRQMQIHCCTRARYMVSVLLPVNAHFFNGCAKNNNMKNKKISLLLLCLLPVAAMACDICGCGVGSYYVGILPQFNKRIAGIRYRYSSLRTHIGAGGSVSYLTTDESYHIAELWGGWNFGKRFRVMATLPYNFNRKINQGNVYEKNGIGDASLQGFYKLVDSRQMHGQKLLIQSLWVGAGLKLATGKYDPVDKLNDKNNPNLFQLGTGSTDFSFNALYDVRLQDVGLSLAASYKCNTTNRYSYRYGNKLSTNAQVYYKFRIQQQLTIAPNAGVAFEYAAHDVDQDYLSKVSGGRLLSASAGLEATYGRVFLSAGFQKPLSQSMASGYVKANNRLMLSAGFAL